MGSVPGRTASDGHAPSWLGQCILTRLAHQVILRRAGGFTGLCCSQVYATMLNTRCSHATCTELEPASEDLCLWNDMTSQGSTGDSWWRSKNCLSEAFAPTHRGAVGLGFLILG